MCLSSFPRALLLWEASVKPLAQFSAALCFLWIGQEDVIKAFRLNCMGKMLRWNGSLLVELPPSNGSQKVCYVGMAPSSPNFYTHHITRTHITR